MDKSAVDLWGCFLSNEKLSPNRVTQPMRLVALAEALAKHGKPRVQPYVAKLNSRCLVACVAMELGFDLAGLRFRGKLAMSRGMLDVWNVEYAKRFGSAVGTAGVKESNRRAVKSQITQTR